MKQGRFVLSLLVLMMVGAACGGGPTPTSEVMAITSRPTEVPTDLPPTNTPPGRLRVTVSRALVLFSGPGEVYAPLGETLAAETEVVAVGRNAAADWALVEYADGRGWIQASEAFADEADGLVTLPIIPVAPVTATPAPATETPTTFPTFTPRPTLTLRPTSSPAPTPEDRDTRFLPAHAFGVLAGNFTVSGEGKLAIDNDLRDYASWQFDPSLRGARSIELTFTCSNDDAALFVQLLNTGRPIQQEIDTLFPACNTGPHTISALEATGLYQLVIELRDARTDEAEITREPLLETDYTFEMRGF